MKTVRTLAIASALLGLTGIGHSQSLVLGDGLARQCYVDALTGDPGRSRTIARCQAALRQIGLSKVHRASTLVNLGILQMRAGSFDDALEAYDKSLQVAPDSPEALINRGAVLIYLDRHEEAVKDLTRSIDMGSRKLPEALYNRALAYDKLEQYELAYNDLTKALELKPGFEEAAQSLSRYTVQSAPE